MGIKMPIKCIIWQLTLFAMTSNVLCRTNLKQAQDQRMQHFQVDGDVHLNATIRKSLVFVVLLPKSVLENENDCILPSVMPTIELAMRKIQEMGFGNANFDVTLVSRDTFCSSTHGGMGFFEIYSEFHEINAVFGLSCDYVLAPVSRYAGVWEIPVLSTSGRSMVFDAKTQQFPTLTRLMGGNSAIGHAIKGMMKDFNWTQTVQIYQNSDKSGMNSNCYFCTVAVHTTLGVISKEVYGITEKASNITQSLKRISKQARIVIMCADPHSIRQIMLAAEELNMIASGEYVFINIELFSKIPHVISEPWKDANDSKINNERAKKAYEAMLTVTPKQPDDEEYIRISDEIKHIASEKYNYSFPQNEPLSTFVTSFYDGVLLYASALNESIREDSDVLNKPINGTDILRRMWNRTFKGITGNVTIDSNGDRVSAYSLLDLNPESGKFEIVAHFLHNRLEYVNGKSIHWAGNRLEPPLDMPICGFDGSLCPDNSLPGYAILSIILGFIVIVMSIGSFIGYRHYKSEAEINSMAWKVSFDDVIIHESVYKCFRGSMHSLIKSKSQVTLLSEDLGSFGGDRQIFIPVGFYKGCKVAIKQIDETSINLNRSLMLELKQMKDIQHDHLVKFFGACLDPPKCFLLTEYCPKGSLQDILENEQIELDWMFKLSLMHDIVRGMHFLHNSDIKSHGNLKSSNCVVDSRFVLKITDFGLNSLKKGNIEDDVENCNSYAYWKKLLWTAPELLKMENRPLDGTPKGDVYSFGIIVHEITTRQGPFYLGCADELSPEEIVQLVKSFDSSSSLNSRPFRPKIVETTSEEICNLMIRCWAEDPLERPDFHNLKTTIRKINKDNETGNIVDNLLKRMEQYANNLEGLVEERTQDYLEEKKKYEKLLYQLLPQTVAAQLISGQPVVAETFDQVTIYFSDIVGFTAISAESTPMEVVKFLNDLYTCFDSIVENYDVYKVETIGDAYMVVSGLPVRNGNLHAREIARLALALLNAVYSFKIHHRPNDQLKLRIGLHSGPCVAGVVGLKMPRYCLFGDTVNTASRMESNGEALRIHISESTKQYLDHFGSFITKERGYVQMKGKGEQLTYWLEGENLPSDSLTKHSQPTTISNCHTPPSYSHHIRQSLRLNQRNSSSSPKLNGDSKTDEMQRFNSFIGVPPPLRQTHDDEHLVDLKNFLTNQNASNDRTNDTQIILSSAPATAAINGNNSKIAHKHFCPHALHGDKVYCNCTTSCSTNNLSRSNNSLNFNNIIKTNNLKNNYKTICNHSSNASEDANNVKCVTQPLLGKISS